MVPITDAETMSEAVAIAYELARPDGVVVLAPACSSFDMFVDYADRGRVFKAEVERLRNEEQRTKNEERNKERNKERENAEGAKNGEGRPNQ